MSFSSIITSARLGELVVLSAGEEQTPAAYKVGPQVLDYYLIHYVLSGKGSFECLGRKYSLAAGNGFVIFPEELATYKSDASDPWRYRWVGLRGTLAHDELLRGSLSPDQPLLQGKGKRTVPRYMNLIRRQLEHSWQSDLRSEAYLRLLLSELHSPLPAKQGGKLLSPKDNGYETVEKAIHWIQTHYHEHFEVNTLARSLGYHRSHFTRLFNQYTEMSPTQYMQKTRMQRAASLLYTSLTIEQIANSVGFDDALYFSRQFKKCFGVPPSYHRNHDFN